MSSYWKNQYQQSGAGDGNGQSPAVVIPFAASSPVPQEVRSGLQEAPKPTVAEVEALAAGPCPGPGGSLWPCAHPEGFGHGGDHVPFRSRFVYVDSADLQQAVCSMDELATSIGELILERERLLSERSELQSIAKIARPLLADWPFTRGASLRRELLKRIDRAVGK